MKVLWYMNGPSPYRIDFLNHLNELMDLTVLIDNEKIQKRDERYFYNKNNNFNNYNLNKFSYFKLRKILKNNYDIIVIQHYAVFNAALLIMMLNNRKIPFIINADGGFVRENESFLSKFLKRFFISKATEYITTSDISKQYLIYYGAKNKKILKYRFSSLKKEDILNKPWSYSEKLKIRKKMGYDYKRLFISVGSFIHRKAYDIFLRSIKSLDYDDVGFIVVGGGPLKNEYLKYINDNNIKNVYFIDFMEKKELFEYLKMSDVFFFPSREDIWGLVINEAMACGLPVISSDNVISSQELLDRKYIYECNDINKQRQLIELFINLSEKKLYDIGVNNLKTIKQYNTTDMAIEHKQIFEEVIYERNNK